MMIKCQNIGLNLVKKEKKISGPSISLPNNFNNQIYQSSDLPALSKVVNFYWSNSQVLFVVKILNSTFFVVYFFLNIMVVKMSHEVLIARIT